jgi:hypothetical protein
MAASSPAPPPCARAERPSRPAFLEVRHLGQHHPVFEVLLHRLDGVDLAFQLRAFAADGLGLFRPVPQGRVLDPCVQLIELSDGDVPVKDAS